MWPAGSAAGCRTGTKARLKPFSRVMWLVELVLRELKGGGVAGMAKPGGRMCLHGPDLGGTVSSQPGRLNPSLLSLNLHVEYVLPVLCSPQRLNTGGDPVSTNE